MLCGALAVRPLHRCDGMACSLTWDSNKHTETDVRASHHPESQTVLRALWREFKPPGNKGPTRGPWPARKTRQISECAPRQSKAIDGMFQPEQPARNDTSVRSPSPGSSRKIQEKSHETTSLHISPVKQRTATRESGKKRLYRESNSSSDFSEEAPPARDTTWTLQRFILQGLFLLKPKRAKNAQIFSVFAAPIRIDHGCSRRRFEPKQPMEIRGTRLHTCLSTQIACITRLSCLKILEDDTSPVNRTPRQLVRAR